MELSFQEKQKKKKHKKHSKKKRKKAASSSLTHHNIQKNPGFAYKESAMSKEISTENYGIFTKMHEFSCFKYSWTISSHSDATV